MKKIIFVGGSTACLYAAKQLQALNFDCIVFEKNPSLKNDSVRRLPNKFLKKIGFIDYENEEYQYIKLTDLKLKLSEHLKIIFNSDIEIIGDKLLLDKKEIAFDYAVIMSGHKQIKSEYPNIFYLDYTIEPEKNHYSGRSLITSIEKADDIIKRIVSLEKKSSMG